MSGAFLCLLSVHMRLQSREFVAREVTKLKMIKLLVKDLALRVSCILPWRNLGAVA